MMFAEACEKAMQYFRDKWNDIGLCSIQDLGDKWLFNGENSENKVVYGKQGITIDKKTGNISLFVLPDVNNFKILEGAKNIEIPGKYVVNN